MSVFTEYDNLSLGRSETWTTREPMSFYLLWPKGPTLVVPSGFSASYSDAGFRWARRFSKLNKKQLGKGAILHDYILAMDARRIVASAVLYEALRAQGGSWLYCFGAFVGSWVKTSIKTKEN